MFLHVCSFYLTFILTQRGKPKGTQIFFIMLHFLFDRHEVTVIYVMVFFQSCLHRQIVLQAGLRCCLVQFEDIFSIKICK